MATHIIASTLPPKKSVEFSRYRIVKPAWITDSIAAGRLLPWTDYRVLDEGPRQKVLKMDDAKGLTQSAPVEKQGYREQTDNSFYTSQLNNNTPLKEKWSQSVEQAGASAKSSKSFASPSIKGSPASNLSTNTPSRASTWARPASRELAPKQEPQPEDRPQNDRPVSEITSEEHNAWILSDPKLREASCQNPNFLEKFYAESRLHHLSTWKAELKSSMQKLTAQKALNEKPAKVLPGTRKYILHVDFDSFFCAVSLKSHPEFAGKPTVVAHGSGPGSEIASCNYPAREFGVKNGMWMKKALEMCPNLNVVPYDFPAYEDASRLFYEAILDVGGVVQSVSIDEALIDVTAVVFASVNSQGVDSGEENVRLEQEKVLQIAEDLRARIRERTGCEVSVGIGANILQAKVALRRAKPAGQYLLQVDDVLDLIGDLKVEQLPGVSYHIGRKLEEIGVSMVKDIRSVSKERLISTLGPKTGEKLLEYSKGIDRTEVGLQPPRKSVSAEVSWGIRFIKQSEADDFVMNLSKELEKRLLNEQVKGRQLTVKIMRRCLDAPLDPAKHLGHGKCDTFNKSATFGVATNSYETIGKEAVSILRSFKFNVGDLRGLGVQMTKLEPMKSGSAAADGSQKRLSFGAHNNRGRTTEATVDEIESPTKPKATPHVKQDDDPIADDPLTPRSKKTHPAMALARAGERDKKANSPLNIGGTQFIIPSNADPAVLAELPNDIRSKLMAQRPKRTKSDTASPPANMDQPMAASGDLPSQVDPDVFNALPDDMKAEILASYGRQSHVTDVKPATDRHPRSVSPSKPASFKRVVGKSARSREPEERSVAGPSRIPLEGHVSAPDSIPDLDPTFLAELPEDVRREVIEDHKRQRLAQQAAIKANARPAETDSGGTRTLAQMKLAFPSPPPKITFAKSGVSSTQEVKDMLEAWCEETKTEGPHQRDVDVLQKHLVRIVLEERDMDKALRLIKWLGVVVGQNSSAGKGAKLWRETLEQLSTVTTDAMRQRGVARPA